MTTNRLLAFALLALAGCGDVESAAPDAGAPDDVAADAAPPVANVAGKHIHTLSVDGLDREVIVYVPELAIGAAPVPAVFMLHGTSGDGERFYNISGWKEKADAEGLIAVFPSALTYCLKEDENGDGDLDDPGERKVTTKWAAGELGTATMPLCRADEIAELTVENQALVDHPLADDVAYLDAVLDLLATEYAVDPARVHASGFSNGAGMTSRLALERADRFAGIAAAAGGLTMPPAPAARPLSMVFSVGTVDDRFTERLDVSEIPITASVFEDHPLLAGIVHEYLVMLQLEEDFTFEEQLVSGARIGRYTFATSEAGAGNTFTFVLVADLGHQYPNGSNHPLVIADPLWTFFASQTLE
jgi:polyhydroxybutyrate depolymerase